jgi:hypothetical protein
MQEVSRFALGEKVAEKTLNVLSRTQCLTPFALREEKYMVRITILLPRRNQML